MRRSAPLIDSDDERVSSIAFWLCSPFLVQWVILNKQNPDRARDDRGFVGRNAIGKR